MLKSPAAEANEESNAPPVGYL